MSDRSTPPRFDRRNPLGRTARGADSVTGAGEASPRRLWGTAAGAVLVGIALTISHHRFLLPLPIAIGFFAVYALAIQAMHRLDARPDGPRGARRLLLALAALSVAVAGIALLVGVGLMVGRGMGWEPQR